MNSRFIYLNNLFTLSDIHVIQDLVASLDSFVFYRILPADGQEFKSLINGCLHIVRRIDLLKEANNALHGSVAVSTIQLDETIRNRAGIISDEEVYIKKCDEADKKKKRDEKIKKIEEKTARKEAREQAERERLEAEAKAAEESAAKEKEASRNPAKAAALRIERER